MTANPTPINRPGDLSPKSSPGTKQYDQNGEEHSDHADTAGGSREDGAAIAPTDRAPPDTGGGSNTQGNDRGRKQQDNEGQGWSARGRAMRRAACAMKLEGIVSKKKGHTPSTQRPQWRLAQGQPNAGS